MSAIPAGNGGLPLADPAAWVASISEGFAAVADGYDAGRNEIFRQAGAWLAETAGLPGEAWVLDLGCGKGAASLPRRGRWARMGMCSGSTWPPRCCPTPGTWRVRRRCRT